MTHQSLYSSITQAVSDGSQREWTLEEINFIASNLNLQQELIECLQNSISDGCWHPENYRTLKSMTFFELERSDLTSILATSLTDISEEVDIPF